MPNLLEKDIAKIRKAKCKTCPFNSDQIEGGNSLAEVLIEKNGLNSSHLCHLEQFHGKKPTYFCRGHRDVMLNALVAQKLLAEATDEEFDKVSNFVASGNAAEYFTQLKSQNLEALKC